jgi:hypothetical protein
MLLCGLYAATTAQSSRPVELDVNIQHSNNLAVYCWQTATNQLLVTVHFQTKLVETAHLVHFWPPSVPALADLRCCPGASSTQAAVVRPKPAQASSNTAQMYKKRLSRGIGESTVCTSSTAMRKGMCILAARDVQSGSKDYLHQVHEMHFKCTAVWMLQPRFKEDNQVQVIGGFINWCRCSVAGGV